MPLDDAIVSALGTALGDPSDDVRRAVAGSLTAILFESPDVVPTLLRGFRDDAQRIAILAALDQDFERDPDSRGLGHFRNGIAGLQAAVVVAIPALRDALELKNDEVTARVFYLLGRIVTFATKSRNEELRKTVEAAVPIYLKGLQQSDPSVRQEVLGQLESTPILRETVAAALLEFVSRTDLPTEDRVAAYAALAAQSTFADSNAGSREPSSQPCRS